MPARFETVRRLLAFVVLFGYGATVAEAAFGAARDGRVHHESTAAAAIHEVSTHGEHGHEDPGAGAEHGPRHQHGTSGDHCTHVHGAAVPALCDFVLISGNEVAIEETPPTLVGARSSTHFHPPKA